MLRGIFTLTLTVPPSHFCPDEWPAQADGRLDLTIKTAFEPGLDTILADSILRVICSTVTGEPPVFKRLICGP